MQLLNKEKILLRAILFLSFNFYFLFSVNAQDTLNPFQDSTIKIINKRILTINGNQISYDSCKSILLSNQYSNPEMIEANKYQLRLNKILPIFEIIILPAAGFGFANQATNYQKPWINTTFVSLAIPGIGLTLYTIRNNKLKYRHFKKAVELYNATIVKPDKTN